MTMCWAAACRRRHERAGFPIMRRTCSAPAVSIRDWRRAHRLQYSVFVGDFKECEYKALREQLLEITADSERRLLLIVPMCAVCEAKTWMAGRPMEESNPSCLIV